MSCERMTRLAMTGRSSSRRRTAAEVSSQLVSMPRMRLVTAEEVGDDALIRGGCPGMFADDLLDDHAVAVEQKAFRYPGRLVDPLDVAARVVQNLEGEAQLVHEAADVLRVPVVDADRQDAQPLGPQLAVELFHCGHFGAAGDAPGGPDVDQGDLAFRLLLDRDRILGAQAHGAVIRRALTHFDAFELRAEAHQRRGAQPTG